MSVILFESDNLLYKNLSQSYEGLKGFATQHICRTFRPEDDLRFYRALRRLYFANVASYLCQYHDETPLDPSTLGAIETFMRFEPSQPSADSFSTALIHQFLGAWARLKYNLCTNDGEHYRAVESYAYLEELAQCYSRAFIDVMKDALSAKIVAPQSNQMEAGQP